MESFNVELEIPGNLNTGRDEATLSHAKFGHSPGPSIVLVESDPETNEVTNEDSGINLKEDDSNWPPLRPKKKGHVAPVSDGVDPNL